MAKTSTELTIAMTYWPTPMLNPMPATTQRVAALVIPRMWPFCAIMLPAPKKPIPVTIPAAILDGSISKDNEIIVKTVAPKLTNMWVLRPAGRCFNSLSNPINAPRAIARNKRNNTSISKSVNSSNNIFLNTNLD